MYILLFFLFSVITSMFYQVYLRFNPAHRLKSGLFLKFTPGAIVSEMRGTIAATTFTKNKAGAAMRNRVTPINRRSSGQTNQRQILSALSAQWRGLTAAQRTAWNSASASFPQTDALGQTIFLTGAQLYVRLNANLIVIGQSAITSPPSPVSFAVLTFTSITADASAGTIALAFSPTVPAGFSMVVRATPPVSPGKTFIPSSAFRQIAVVAAAATSPQATGTAYTTVFGAITGATGQKIFYEIFLVDNASGLAGIPVRGSGIVVA
jgi:hypothetical protein